MAQQLGQLSKHSSSNGSSNTSLQRAEQGNAAPAPAAAWDEEQVIQQDIRSLLGQLKKLVLHDMPAAATTVPHKAVVNRYQTILQDLQADIDKTVARVRQAKERRELLAGSSAAGGMAVQDPATEHLLRERNHIHNSMRAADNVLGQADQIRSDLRGQGRSIGRSGTLLGQMTQAVPGLNHVVEQIRRRRSRDDYIVAGVIASCVLITLWYVFG